MGALSLWSFRVAGHMDNTPIQTPRFPSNWELLDGRVIEGSFALMRG
jgi:flagellar motor protein MotB